MGSTEWLRFAPEFTSRYLGGNMKKVKRFEGYKVLWLLREYKEPWTVPEVCEELNIRQATAMRHLKELWAFDFVYVCGWEHTYQHWRPIYRWGCKQDAPRPKPVGGNICRQRRYWATRLARTDLTPDQREKALAKQRHWETLFKRTQEAA